MTVCGDKAGIVEALTIAARKIRKANERGNSLWTRRFKEALRELGKESNFEVWGKDLHWPGGRDGRIDGANFHEWLFDLCWARCQGPWNTFKGLAMACEIEWGTDQRSHDQDFSKLTVVEADLRLFVFGCKPREEESRFAHFQEASRYSPGKAYLTLAVPDGWNKQEQLLPHESWIS